MFVEQRFRLGQFVNPVNLNALSVSVVAQECNRHESPAAKVSRFFVEKKMILEKT
jgi:hypothetical protein